MNWDAIGAISEGIGAIAVVVTLAYLGQQVRQNSRLLRSQTDSNAWSHYAESLTVLASSPQASALLVKGFRSMSALTEEERMQFLSLCMLALNSVEYQFRQMEDTDPEVEMLWSIANIYVGTPGGLEFWTAYRSSFSPRFISWLDGCLKRAN